MEYRLSDPALKHCPLHYVSNEIRGNKEIALIVCRRVGLALELVSDALKDDSELVLEVCHQNGWALQFASCKPQADKEIVLTAVSVNGEALKFAPNDLNQNMGLDHLDPSCSLRRSYWLRIRYGIATVSVVAAVNARPKDHTLSGGQVLSPFACS